MKKRNSALIILNKKNKKGTMLIKNLRKKILRNKWRVKKKWIQKNIPIIKFNIYRMIILNI